jgi:xanthine dehydrogenase accessory factor
VTGDWLAEAAALRQAGEPFALATVVRCERPTSARPGARAIVRADGSVSGWVGGSCAEPVTVKEALAALADGEGRLLVLRGDGTPLPGRAEGVREYAMTCHSGGTLEIYVEPVLPAPALVLAGGGPVVETLARLGEAAGFAVTVVDPEAAPGAAAAAQPGLDVARPARPAAPVAPAAGGTGVSPPGSAPAPPAGPAGTRRVVDLGGLPLGPRTAVVVATHGRFDEDALERALDSEAGYVSLVASPRRAAAVADLLRARGIPLERLARLKAPAGLDLGAVTPQEIAVSILAEIVARRRHSPTGPAGPTGGALAAGAGAAGTGPAAATAATVEPATGATAGPVRPAAAGAAAAPATAATAPGAPAGPGGAGAPGRPGPPLIAAPARPGVASARAAAAAPGATAAPAEARDPVCGMSVRVATARYRTDTPAGPVHFCCAACQHRFELEPARYAAAPGP